jgi:hypothetical protein
VGRSDADDPGDKAARRENPDVAAGEDRLVHPAQRAEAHGTIVVQPNCEQPDSVHVCAEHDPRMPGTHTEEKIAYRILHYTVSERGPKQASDLVLKAGRTGRGNQRRQEGIIHGHRLPARYAV